MLFGFIHRVTIMVIDLKETNMIYVSLFLSKL